MAVDERICYRFSHVEVVVATQCRACYNLGMFVYVTLYNELIQKCIVRKILLLESSLQSRAVADYNLLSKTSIWLNVVLTVLGTQHISDISILNITLLTQYLGADFLSSEFVEKILPIQFFGIRHFILRIKMRTRQCFVSLSHFDVL